MKTVLMFTAALLMAACGDRAEAPSNTAMNYQPANEGQPL